MGKKQIVDVYFNVWIKNHLCVEFDQNCHFLGQYEIIWENQKINSDFDKKSRVGGVGSSSYFISFHLLFKTCNPP